LFDAADLEIQEHLQSLGRPSVRHLLALEKALAAWAGENRTPTAAALATSAAVPARIAEALLMDLEEAGLIEHVKGAIRLAVPLAAFRAGARELVAKVKTFRFEGERKLKTVAAYATSDECRSVFIRRYFGEEMPPRCGTCDRCRALTAVPAPIAASPQPAAASAKPAAAPPKAPRKRRRRRRKRPATTRT
jgi:ATP-dependent DNA helicase RecQ